MTRCYALHCSDHRACSLRDQTHDLLYCDDLASAHGVDGTAFVPIWWKVRTVEMPMQVLVVDGRQKAPYGRREPFQFGHNRQNLLRRKTSRLDEGWGSTLWGFCISLNRHLDKILQLKKEITLSWGYGVVAMYIVRWVFWKYTCNMMKIWKDTFAICWPILVSVCAHLSSWINPTPILNIGHRPEQGGL